MFPKFRFPSLSSRFLFFRSLPCPLPLLLQFSYCSFFSFVSLSLSLSYFFLIWYLAYSLEFPVNQSHRVQPNYRPDNRCFFYATFVMDSVSLWKRPLERFPGVFLSFPSPSLPPSALSVFIYLMVTFFFQGFQVETRVSKKKTFRSGQA